MLFGDGPSAGGFAELGVPGLNFVSSAFGFYQCRRKALYFHCDRFRNEAQLGMELLLCTRGICSDFKYSEYLLLFTFF